MGSVKEQMKAAGIDEPFVPVKVTNEDAIMVIKKLLAEGYTLIIDTNAGYSGNIICDFYKDGVPSPHRVALRSNGMWHLNAGLRI